MTHKSIRMKRIIITSLFIISLLHIQAQNRRVDSLKTLLAKEKTDTGKVNLLNELGGRFGFGRLRNDSSFWYSQQALELSQKTNYPKGEIKARFNMTNYLFQTGNYPEGLKLSLYNLKMAGKFHDMETFFLQTRVIGWIYGRMGDKKKQLEYEKQLASLAPLVPVNGWADRKTLIWIANNVMAMAYSDLNMQDSTLYYLLLVYEGAKKIKKPSLLSLATSGLGNYYLKIDNDSLALFYFKKCIPYAINGGRFDGVVHAETAIAKVFLKRGESDSALSYGRHALNNVQTIDAPEAQQEVYSLLSTIYSNRHQYDSDYKYEHSFGILKDSLYNQAKITQAQNFAFNETLQQQQLEQAKKDAQQQYATKIKFYILAAIILVFLIVAFLLLRNVRNKRKANILLSKQKEEIQTALSELKSTQSQLIQSEKMASLGELTAGIAHEIQNPLNFVNNFSEINKELAGELKSELATGNMQSANEIADDIIDNSEKINHHGKRADAIVKGMLEHSRTSTGEKEPTDINKLADEYLRLAYHGMRAKGKSFNCTLETHFDETLEKINVVPQDIGRVLLNLFNNAYYACAERSRSTCAERSRASADSADGYVPTVTVVTRKYSLSSGEGRGEAIITVRDNGNGIPEKIKDKIFQPFFTTKPTGSGTGLGLSLSYDIITKEHNGTIKVESEEGEGTEFIIRLPVN